MRLEGRPRRGSGWRQGLARFRHSRAGDPRPRIIRKRSTSKPPTPSQIETSLVPSRLCENLDHIIRSRNCSNSLVIVCGIVDFVGLARTIPTIPCSGNTHIQVLSVPKVTYHNTLVISGKSLILSISSVKVYFLQLLVQCLSLMHLHTFALQKPEEQLASLPFSPHKSAMMLLQPCMMRFQKPRRVF